MTKLTPYQKIMRAAERGRSLRLTADEVWALSRDSAVETVAYNDDEARRAEAEADKSRAPRK